MSLVNSGRGAGDGSEEDAVGGHGALCDGQEHLCRTGGIWGSVLMARGTDGRRRAAAAADKRDLPEPMPPLTPTATQQP